MVDTDEDPVAVVVFGVPDEIEQDVADEQGQENGGDEEDLPVLELDDRYGGDRGRNEGGELREGCKY
ncbi:hypothetical protein F441_04329 [Phytophthora nicotianae CJ01A1]|uniref:Uncharacterized protein n=6 Tax=Phytophthora nicotianae TaxID=4792 RepID=W2PCB3_PHYN3|nr:hypothetical protein PPTG_24673 [Phytophthora nicotianae INRA-310]ETI52504.1 hypothetical protein F443_04367 [Phytophthora nicotianae P1569]ETO81279.1 hypothetical protein F444_04385 [Phytophthora nicotianae P1976]ETP22336.1 hypothetical protein F441_04329 [Phytophthora nicotianae CJ01A1]ETP50227.1 hypothetical protein F442_04395 [Phytophthora nicotianae P10297]ETM98270.1 hypothetical protein PPTG_24673 [Phytophthora nicotianae INRA-310]